MNNLPKVSVSLCLDSDNENLFELSKYIDVQPTRIRGIEDWPDAIKNNKDLPEKLKPHYAWELKFEDYNCKNIAIPFEKLIEKITGKENKINELVTKNKWEIGIVVTIDTIETDKPYIGINAETIAFANSLNSGIDFEIFTYFD